MPRYSLDGISPEVPADDKYWIAPDAQVIGKVVIGIDASIWFGSCLRGDNETITIGPGTNVQEHCTLHTDMGFPLTTGRGCTIGHGAILHGCTLGDHVLVGMGATVLNGAKIGEGSLVGAGALVTEGKEFPPHSLIVGSPARAIRTLDAAAMERMREGADAYMRNWKRFAKGMKRLPD